jgi:hypothetical protein
LGGQILLIGGASGVPDKQRAHGTPPGLGPVGSRVAPTRASGSARLKQPGRLPSCGCKGGSPVHIGFGGLPRRASWQERGRILPNVLATLRT